MNELTIVKDGLIKIYLTDEGAYVVNGRELWQGLGSKQDFSTWAKKRLNECDAVENEDYFRFHKKMEANNASMIEYIIKLDTAKEMAMLERNEIGKKYRRYLIEVEKRYKQQLQTTTSVDDTKQTLAQAKLCNALARRANALMKAADKLSADQQQKLYQQAAKLLAEGELAQSETCLSKPRCAGQYHLTANDKTYLRSMAKDGVIQLDDYISGLRHILNDEIELPEALMRLC